MSILLNFFQLFSIISVLLYEYKNESFMVFLWGTLLLMFGIPHFSTLFIEVEYPKIVLNYASLFVGLFNVVYLIIRVMINVKFPIKFKRNEELITKRRTDKIYVRTILILLIFYSVYTFINYTIIFGSIKNVNWGVLYLSNRNLSTFGLIKNKIINSFFILGSSLVLVSLIKKNKIMLLITVTSSLIWPMINGNRIRILPLMTSLLIYHFIYKKREINVTTIFLGSLFSILSIIIVYFLRLSRIYGGMYLMFSNNKISHLLSEAIKMIFEGNGELSLRKAFYHFIYHNNNFENFNKGHTYLRLLLILVPSKLTGGIKPPDFAIKMGSAWLMNPTNKYYSMHPTFYGDVFANFWWYGILFAIPLVLLIKVIETIHSRRSGSSYYLHFVLLSTSMTIIGRGSVYNASHELLVNVFISILILYLSKFISDFRGKKRKKYD